ncbi:unnamed protein product, partial [Urochloa humidicola]
EKSSAAVASKRTGTVGGARFFPQIWGAARRPPSPLRPRLPPRHRPRGSALRRARWPAPAAPASPRHRQPPPPLLVGSAARAGRQPLPQLLRVTGSLRRPCSSAPPLDSVVPALCPGLARRRDRARASRAVASFPVPSSSARRLRAKNQSPAFPWEPRRATRRGCHTSRRARLQQRRTTTTISNAGRCSRRHAPRRRP